MPREGYKKADDVQDLRTYTYHFRTEFIFLEKICFVVCLLLNSSLYKIPEENNRKDKPAIFQFINKDMWIEIWIYDYNFILLKENPNKTTTSTQTKNPNTMNI